MPGKAPDTHAVQAPVFENGGLSVCLLSALVLEGGLCEPLSNVINCDKRLTITIIVVRT